MTVISLVDDAALLSPSQMSRKLAELTAGGDVAADYYGNGGAVSAFEAKIAAHLGKERAVIFPTGTLANLCAMRVLAGPGPARILTHRHSHFFNDSGDNLAAIGGYTMVPLEGASAGFGAQQVEDEIVRAADARVASRIGCITVESPSRRMEGRRFGTERINAISAIAKTSGIPMFLDGARMLIECAITGQSPAEMSQHFDLVYVSLYKYLDSPFGCVLAGDANRLEDLFHERRRYGGGLWQMWPAAVLASAKLDGFSALWQNIQQHAEAVFEALDGSDLRVERLADGTNAVRIHLANAPADPSMFSERAAEAGLKLPGLSGQTMTIKMNESWLALPPEELAGKLKEMNTW